jgi:hypothetical protein
METLILAVYATECGQSLRDLGTGFADDLERIRVLVQRCAENSR